MTASRLALSAALFACLPSLVFAQTPLPPHDKLLREIYQELIEINTTDSVGDCTQAARAMGARLATAGFAEADMQVLTPAGAPRKGNLVARLKGSGGAGGPKPILMLAHIDVVEAKREDWERDPFKLIEENGFFYARGSSDDKPMAAIYVSEMIRFKREGFKPKRDIVMALTCDEETGGTSAYNGVEFLIKHHKHLIDAEIALNEGGGGGMDKDGKPKLHGIQAGEKTFQSFQLEVTNPGGHSSVPVKNNAIYHLADGLSRLGKYDFPFKLSATTRAYFAKRADLEPAAMATDMRAILREPPDMEAAARLSTSGFYNASLRTTCVATLLDAGHAANALPQRARATVNCRILPGETVEEVQKTLVRVLADDQIKVTILGRTTVSTPPPLTPTLMKAVEDITAELWPGIPVVPTMSSGATDGRFLNNAGIWTYGITGMFHYPDGSRAHGLNERLPVKSLYAAHEFQYRLVKRLAM